MKTRALTLLPFGLAAAGAFVVACNLILGLQEPQLVQSLDGGDGGCAKSCLGGACVSGQCQPVAIATAQTDPFNVALSPGDVFWTDYLGNIVNRASKLDGGPPSIFATGKLTDKPFGITSDDSAIYFSNYGQSGTVVRCPFDGCSGGGIIFDAGVGQTAITVNGNFLYFLQPLFEEIDYMAKTGGTSTAIAMPSTATPDSDLADIASDGTYIYWSEPFNSVIKRQLIAGGQPESVVSGLVTPRRIIVDQGVLFYVDRHTSNNDDVVGFVSASASADAGAGTPLTTTAQRPTGLAIDAQYVYWTDFGDLVNNAPTGNGGIFRAPRNGQGSPEQLASNVSAISVAVDDLAIYFVTIGSGSGPPDGAVWRLAK